MNIIWILYPWRSIRLDWFQCCVLLSLKLTYNRIDHYWQLHLWYFLMSDLNSMFTSAHLCITKPPLCFYSTILRFCPSEGVWARAFSFSDTPFPSHLPVQRGASTHITCITMVALLKPPYPFYSHTDPLVSRADGLLYNTHTHTLRESIVLMNTLFKHLRIVLKLRWFKGSQHIWYVLDLPRQIHLLEWMTGPLTQPEWCVRSSRLKDGAIELTRSIDQRETKDKWSLVAIERKSVSDCNLESSLSECINTQSECVGFVSEHTLIFEDFMSPRGQWS